MDSTHLKDAKFRTTNLNPPSTFAGNNLKVLVNNVGNLEIVSRFMIILDKYIIVPGSSLFRQKQEYNGDGMSSMPNVGRHVDFQKKDRAL